MTTRSMTLQLEFSNRTSRSLAGSYTFSPPSYYELLETASVFHRDQIYGSGPPNQTVHPELLNLVNDLPDPLLDFGCGRGALLMQLRSAGRQISGIELDSPRIRAAISPEYASSITLYDGAFPSPFREGSFRSVICSEVLEHIPNYQEAIAELARLATDKLLLTVPDCTAIPIGYRQGAVPWHLLESTHVNFFTQRSLAEVLQPYFSRLEFGRIGQAYFNDSTYFVSLAVLCSK